MAWSEEKHNMLSFNELLPPTRWTSHPQILFFTLSDVRKWLLTPLLFSHWVFISDCPLICSSLCGDWPPQPPVDGPLMHSQICSQEGAGEEKIRLLSLSTRTAAFILSSLLFLFKSGDEKYPKSLKMTSIKRTGNHYRSEQKSSWEIPWWKLL